MVQIKNIPASEFIKIGFNSKIEAKKFGLKSLPNESQENYLKRLSKELKKIESENDKLIKKINNSIKKIDRIIESKLDIIKIYYDENKLKYIKNLLNLGYKLYYQNNENLKNILIELSNIDDDIKKIINEEFNKKQELIEKIKEPIKITRDEFISIKNYMQNYLTGEEINNINKKIKLTNKLETLNSDEIQQLYDDIESIREEINEIKNQNKFYKSAVEKINNMSQGDKININYGENTTTLKRIINYLYKTLKNESILLNTGGEDGVFYALNDNTYGDLINALEESKIGLISDVEVIGSDISFVMNVINNYDDIIIQWEEPPTTKTNKHREGGYFPYNNISNIDLTRYQIISVDGDIKIFNDNCLIYALRILGLELNKIEYLKSLCLRRHIPNNKLKDICLNLKIRLEITYETTHHDIKKYGTEGPIYKLGLIDGHYFANENINISTYYVKNYDKLNNIKDGKYIIEKRQNGTYKYDKNYKTSSYKIIKLMMENKEIFFSPITTNFIQQTIFHDKVKNIETLNFLDINIRNVEKNFYKLDEPKNNNKFYGKSQIKGSGLDNSNPMDTTEYYYNEKIIGDFKDVYFIDFETDTSKQNHKAFMISYLKFNESNEYNFNDIKCLWGKYCALNFLETLKNDTIIIAHNMDYDFRFFIKEVSHIVEISRNNSLMNCDGKYWSQKMKRHINIKFICSQKMINMKLSKFPETFMTKEEQKDIKKEVMPYGFYTYENFSKYQKYAPIEEAKQYILTDDEQKIFIENIEKLNCFKREFDNTTNNLIVDKLYFDYKKYSNYYCMMDTFILAKGYSTFRKWMYDITTIDYSYSRYCKANDIEGKPIMNINQDGDEKQKEILINVSGRKGIDILNYISLASVADTYLKFRGCYEGVCEFSGVIREFIMRCVVGARTMTRDNKKFECKDKVSDFDAVSLYPSAMARLGFVLGKPKEIINKKFEDIKNFDEYFIEIKFVCDLKIRRHFPLISDKINGIREWTNDTKYCNEKQNTFFVDKITLEDIIEYHGMTKDDFEIIRGYYFDSGLNNTIQNVITELFENRRKYKRAGNPIEMVFKELMNSAYGKNIMKSTMTDIKYVDTEEEYKKIVKEQYNQIHSVSIVSGFEDVKESKNGKTYKKYRIRMYEPIAKDYTRPHCGSRVLSMSKRIMNEVMCLAEDNEIIINYQDTDSMHIYADQIDNLSKLFKNKYDRELIGEDMGQFHTDFSLPGLNKKEKESLVSIKQIYLGKKSYIDCLEGIKENGEIVSGYHTRMKGIPEKSIDHYVEKFNKINNSNINTYSVYEQLLKSDKLAFDLACRDDNDKPTRVCFVKNFNKSISTRNTPYIRIVQFKD